MVCFEKSSWHVGRISVNTELELAKSEYILMLFCKCNNVRVMDCPG